MRAIKIIHGRAVAQNPVQEERQSGLSTLGRKYLPWNLTTHTLHTQNLDAKNINPHIARNAENSEKEKKNQTNVLIIISLYGFSQSLGIRNSGRAREVAHARGSQKLAELGQAYPPVFVDVGLLQQRLDGSL